MPPENLSKKHWVGAEIGTLDTKHCILFPLQILHRHKSLHRDDPNRLKNVVEVVNTKINCGLGNVGV